MKRLLSWVWPSGPGTLAYMLQQFEYNPTKFMRWIAAVPDLTTARKRGTLTLTRRGQLTLILAYAAYVLWVVVSVWLAIAITPWEGLLALLGQPVAAFLLLGFSTLVQLFVVNPRQQSEITKATRKLAKLSSVNIAILGSYGKTSMKELLLTILAEGKNVAATPGNKNVLISHARWVSQLKGDEDVLIFEYGEAEPGDIAKLASFSKPGLAIVTGIAPAHLDYYPDLDAIADDFASIQDFVKTKGIFCNRVSPLLSAKLAEAILYDENGLDGWDISNEQVSFEGMSFVMQKDKHVLKLHSGLLGKHQVGPLAAAVVVAKRLGLSDEQIRAGVAKTRPYEHRMEPRQLHGAWIIDDAYNGNIEGMKAGLELLETLPAKRRIYVTPGLVDQGVETERVHRELGNLIARAAPDRVVLMQNSVIQFIQQGLEEAGYQGKVQIETDPLAYYTSLDQHVAYGDVVMLQNDWPDSYK